MKEIYFVNFILKEISRSVNCFSINSLVIFLVDFIVNFGGFFGLILSDNCDIFSTLLENVELDQTWEKWTGKYKNIIIYGFLY